MYTKNTDTVGSSSSVTSKLGVHDLPAVVSPHTERGTPLRLFPTTSCKLGTSGWGRGGGG